MTKGECLQIVSACGSDDMSDTLLELAIAMKLEEGHSKEEVIDMVGLVLEDSEGLEETG
jgi:hypothetical protein